MHVRSYFACSSSFTDTNCSASAASHAAGGADIIGIDLGTTNSCVAVMEGKVAAAAASARLLLLFAGSWQLVMQGCQLLHWF